MLLFSVMWLINQATVQDDKPEQAYRTIALWTYASLFKESEVIVIGRAIKTRDAEQDETVMFPGVHAGNVRCVVTRFLVMQWIKGANEPKEIDLVHFRYRTSPSPEVGPLLMGFEIRPLSQTEKENNVLVQKTVATSDVPHYLLFLKKSTKQMYACVSGQYNARSSVMLLMRPAP